MTKTIIFDMDGVLFDTIPFARKSFLKRHPGVTGKMYNDLHAGNYHEEAEKYSHLRVRETEKEKNKREIGYAETKSKTPAFEGVVSLLKELHILGFRLILNTNAFDKNCIPLLEFSGIRDVFDFLATGDISKDKVEKFTFEEKYSINKKDILFVTDAVGDIKDAQKAGISTVAVTW